MELQNLLGCAVGQAAARQFGAARIDGPATLLDVNDFSVLINHERGAVRHSRLGNKNAILRGDLALRKIAQQRYGKVQLGCELFL